MTGLVSFVREFGRELILRADTIDTEAKKESDPNVIIVALASAATLRQIAGALAAAAKATFLA